MGTWKCHPARESKMPGYGRPLISPFPIAGTDCVRTNQNVAQSGNWFYILFCRAQNSFLSSPVVDQHCTDCSKEMWTVWFCNFDRVTPKSPPTKKFGTCFWACKIWEIIDKWFLESQKRGCTWLSSNLLIRQKKAKIKTTCRSVKTREAFSPQKLVLTLGWELLSGVTLPLWPTLPQNEHV